MGIYILGDMPLGTHIVFIVLVISAVMDEQKLVYLLRIRN